MKYYIEKLYAAELYRVYEDQSFAYWYRGTWYEPILSSRKWNKIDSKYCKEVDEETAFLIVMKNT